MRIADCGMKDSLSKIPGSIPGVTTGQKTLALRDNGDQILKPCATKWLTDGGLLSFGFPPRPLCLSGESNEGKDCSTLLKF